jgi:hypothetical protein
LIGMKEVKLVQLPSRNKAGRCSVYLGSIPNTPEHRQLVLKISKLLRPYGKVQIEGRHSNRKLLAEHLCAINHPSCFVVSWHTKNKVKMKPESRRRALTSHVPVEFAESFDVYLFKTRKYKNQLDGIPKYWNLDLQTATLLCESLGNV